jgi:hypothetical protein
MLTLCHSLAYRHLQDARRTQAQTINSDAGLGGQMMATDTDPARRGSAGRTGAGFDPRCRTLSPGQWNIRMGLASIPGRLATTRYDHSISRQL